MNVSFLMKLNSIKSAANHSSKMPMHPMWLSTAKPNIKIRQKGCPRTSRFCDKIQYVHDLSFGCEPTDESLSGIASPKVYHMYREGAKDAIDGTVDGDMFDIKRQKAENLQSSTRLVPTSVLLAGISWSVLKNVLTTRVLNTRTTSSSYPRPTTTSRTQDWRS